MTGQELRKLKELNQKPVNLNAARVLRQVKESPESDQLHVLQLAQWARESGKLKVEDLRVQETLEGLLYRWNPERAYQYLQLNTLEQEKKPLKQAQRLYERLNERLSASLRDYPRANPLP